MSENLSDTLTAEDCLSLLSWHVAMGADEVAVDSPINWLENPPEMDMIAAAMTAAPNAPNQARPSPHSAERAKMQAAPKSAPRTVAPRPVQATTGGTPEQAKAAAQAATSLEALKAAIEAFDGGSLKRSAKNTVFCDGTVGADLMVVGEAPGAEEDRAGRPFVGPVGQFFDRILMAAGFNRAENTYITNLVNWRPIGNQTPDPAICAMCKPFVERHIELAKPKVVLLLGGTSAKTLLNETGGISRLRGKWHDLQFGDHKVAALATYHPAYLLRQPAFKAQAWRDMLEIKAKLQADA